MRHLSKPLLLSALAFTSWLGVSAQTNGPERCMTTAEYAAITYSWTGEDNIKHENVPITVKATDPYQIYELLRTVYCDSRVPGPKYTAYDYDRNTRSYYRANGTYYGDNDGGWNIRSNPSQNEIDNGYMKVTAPAEEGYTVLMVALKNNCKPAFTDNRSHTFANKTQLINYISNNIESVELLTDAMRLGQGEYRGTVFNISGTYNRFFFLSKGRARVDVKGTEVPFERMFEQFSPSGGSTAEEMKDDYYRTLMAGEQYPVLHDCSSVMENKHYFSMSGESGTQAYAMDGLNFFIPDYRLKWVSGTMRNSNDYGDDTRTMIYKEYNNYYFVGHYAKYTTQLPSTMVYKINLNAERSEVVNGQYTVTLNWESSLDVINGAPVNQEFYVYRYVFNPETGERSRELLDVIGDYTQPTTGYEWVYTVPQEESSYSITYVVTGKPIDELNHDNSYKFKDTDSNDATVVFPGTDELEALQLTIDGGYVSTYNVNKEVNEYKNYITMGQGIGTTKLTANHLNNGQTLFKVYRYNNVTNEKVHAGDIIFTKSTLSSWGRVTGYRINWSIYYDASESADVATSSSRRIDVGVDDVNNPLEFNIKFCDQFNASTKDNTHPSLYTYRVEFEAGNNGGHSNRISVPVKKTELKIKGSQYTHEQVYGEQEDEYHKLAVNTNNVEMTVKAYDDNILRYEIDRGDNGSKPVLNEPLVGAQRLDTGNGYQPMVRQGNDLVAQGDKQYFFEEGKNYVDVPLTDVAKIDGVTSYVPVIRTYPPKGIPESEAKYNTYGAPIETFALGKILSIDAKTEISDYTWNENGKNYCYYKVNLDVTGQIPAGYEAVGFRAWRMCDKAHESYAYTQQTTSDGQENPRYDARIVKRQNDALDPQKGYMLERSFDEGYGERATSPSVTLGATPLQGIENEWTGTFGAEMITYKGLDEKIKQGLDELVVNYLVRMYYTLSDNQSGPNLAPSLNDAAPKTYFVVEQLFPLVISGESVITAVTNISADREVSGVMYYNTMGLPSVTPWQGVNIVVTRYTDGTTSTTKVVR